MRANIYILIAFIFVARLAPMPTYYVPITNNFLKCTALSILNPSAAISMLIYALMQWNTPLHGANKNGTMLARLTLSLITYLYDNCHALGNLFVYYAVFLFTLLCVLISNFPESGRINTCFTFCTRNRFLIISRFSLLQRLAFFMMSSHYQAREFTRPFDLRCASSDSCSQSKLLYSIVEAVQCFTLAIISIFIYLYQSFIPAYSHSSMTLTA